MGLIRLFVWVVLASALAFAAGYLNEILDATGWGSHFVERCTFLIVLLRELPPVARWLVDNTVLWVSARLWRKKP